MRVRQRDRQAAARRRRERMMRRAAAAAVTVAVMWLVIRWGAGTGAADYAAGFVSGAVVAAAIPDMLRRPVERLTRQAGTAARRAVSKPIPHRLPPESTPIRDYRNAQEGS
jgi:hypothetical protein